MSVATLVLEGGGMRGLFTAGVLDCFLDNDLIFENCIGVSAGACHGVSYACGQRGRARDVSVNFLHLKEYCGMYSFLTTGDFFGVKMVYEDIPKNHYPLDVAAYKAGRTKLYSVVTNCKSGKAEYKEIMDPYKDLNWIRASASLPLVSHKVKIGENYYLDGGIADSVPIEKSIELWGGKQVVVLTQPKGYLKGKSRMYPLLKLRYKNYPSMVGKMKIRHLEYNRVINKIDNLEKNGEIFVIRPQKNLNIGRTEKDKDKLLQVYDVGYKTALKLVDKINKYLN